MNRKAIRKVLLLVNLSRISGRDILSAVLRYSGVKGNWQTKIVQVQEYAPGELAGMISGDSFDGIISSEMETPEVADTLERSTIPLAVIGTRR